MALRHLVLLGALALIGAALVWVFWDAVAVQAPGRLADLALDRVPESGVSNPVTAVLTQLPCLRHPLGACRFDGGHPGYLVHGPGGDRLSAGRGSAWQTRSHDRTLLILSAVYLLWVGGHAPGGAFQAGALLGAAGVILRLSGRPDAGLPPLTWLRLGIVLGVSAFVAAALVLMAAGYGFLTFPLAVAKWVILAIETAATLAIGATLAAAYLAGEPAAARRDSQPGQ
jgi:hypothetical protein